MVVPCRDQAARIVALLVRRDDASHGRGKYLYLSSAGAGGPGPGAPPHVPLGVTAGCRTGRLTEGALKADVAAALSDVPTVGAAGLAWRPALDVLVALGCGTVRLSFDADAPDNAHVARALADCCADAGARGLTIELERWDPAVAKGIDDLLAAGKAPEVLQGDAVLQAVREIQASASAEAEPAPPDELARLQDVLNAGGAEALLRDKSLLQALADLAVSDPAAFAAVRASIRERVCVRDLDKALRPLRRKAPSVMAQIRRPTPSWTVAFIGTSRRRKARSRSRSATSPRASSRTWFTMMALSRGAA